ncbi:PAQR family membrane homeostasis protein TrhA [Christiangramia aquimixticola]|uniref:PAQR family membrane homeostasis protein TrhA n=1 Tax=Christiangramia aquimixticola TaxID=1697558 RepID=UPI003AA9765C
MKNIKEPKYYPEKEEKLNILTHGLGLALSVIAMVLLVIKAVRLGDSMHLLSFSIFGASMILLYAASTFYHSASTHQLRKRLNILDHAAIYVLIAGTYTPFALVTLRGTTGWVIFWVVWAMALAGVILKLFYTGKFKLLSTIMYVVMGWIIIFAIGPLMDNLSNDGIFWLIAGGISYTLGAILFMLHRIPYNHGIFHIFVLLGTFSHFMVIYFHILPGR